MCSEAGRVSFFQDVVPSIQTMLQWTVHNLQYMARINWTQRVTKKGGHEVEGMRAQVIDKEVIKTRSLDVYDENTLF